MQPQNPGRSSSAVAVSASTLRDSLIRSSSHVVSNNARRLGIARTQQRHRSVCIQSSVEDVCRGQHGISRHVERRCVGEVVVGQLSTVIASVTAPTRAWLRWTAPLPYSETRFPPSTLPDFRSAVSVICTEIVVSPPDTTCPGDSGRS